MIPIGLHVRQTCQPITSHRGRQSDFYGCGKVHEPLMKSHRQVTIPGSVNDN